MTDRTRPAGSGAELRKVGIYHHPQLDAARDFAVELRDRFRPTSPTSGSPPPGIPSAPPATCPAPTC